MVKQTVSVGVSIWTRILRFVDKLDLTIGITSILLLYTLVTFLNLIIVMRLSGYLLSMDE